MEVFLLMIVLVFLIAIISSINSKFKASQDNFNKVLQKVEQLQKQLQSFEGKEVVSSKQEIIHPKVEIPTPIIEKEIPKVVQEVKETIPSPKFEKSKEPEEGEWKEAVLVYSILYILYTID